MHVRTRGLAKAALLAAVVLLAFGAANAKAWNAGYTVPTNSSFGTTSCPTLSGPTFIQNGDFCFYFPNGSASTSALCDPSFCGTLKFNLTSPGTFTATLNYASPNFFNLIGLQLCQDNQTVPDPATCSQTSSPGGAGVPGCSMDITPNDNGTPADTTDDTATTTLTCPITATDTADPYTLIVYPISILNCTDPSDITCATDLNNGVTAALSGSFSGTLTSTGPVDAKVEGGGEVAPQQHFSLNAFNNPAKWTKAHVRFGIASNDLTKCMFAADGANFVDIEPSMTGSGGTATITGTGTVTDSLKVKHTVSYQLQVTDGGKGGTDTFQLQAMGCDTHGLAVPVSHGNIHIDNHNHDND